MALSTPWTQNPPYASVLEGPSLLLGLTITL